MEDTRNALIVESNELCWFVDRFVSGGKEWIEVDVSGNGSNIKLFHAHEVIVIDRSK